MKTHINLLPPDAQKAKKFRKRIKFLLLAQCGIFLLLGASIFLLNNAERYVWQASRALAERVSALAPEIEENTRALAIREILAETLPIEFDGEWLDRILFAIPDGTTLTRIDYNRGELLISAHTADINTIESHRANMAHLFTYVRAGHIRAYADGYSYEIRIIFEQ
ncbi:MAG: hypothetical protein FWF77_03410 [Defluviitaleaceae bacterium]|nr:hypothetical protein [Defluviitaleaceae bacterium]